MRNLIDLKLLVLAIVGLPAALGIFVAPAAIAEDQSRSESPTDVRVVRENLMNIMGTYERIFKRYKLDDQLLGSLIEAEQHLEGMSDQDLAVMAEAIAPKVAKLSRMVDELEKILLTDPATRRAASSPGFPGAPYPNVDFDFIFLWDDQDEAGEDEDGDEPEAGALCNEIRRTANERYAALALVILAEGLRDIAGRFCDQQFLGFSCNLCCIPTDIIYLVVKFLYEDILLCDDLIDSAEIEGSYDRLGHVHDDLAAHDTNIDTDLAAHDLNIDTDLAAHDLNIDTDLAQHDTDIKALLGNVQTTLELMKRLHIDVIQVEEKKHYLLAVTEAGNAVSGAMLVSVHAGAPKKGIPFQDITGITSTTELRPGVLEVRMGSLPGAVDSDTIFQFLVEEVGHGPFTHSGTALVSGDSNSTFLGPGQ